MYKIGSASTLEIEGNKVIVITHRDMRPTADTVVVSFIIFGLLLVCAPLFGINEKAGLIILLVSIELGYGYHFLWNVRSEMDLASRTVVRKKRVGKIVYRKSTMTLPLKYNFNYSVKKDYLNFLYRKAKNIWLKADCPEQKESIKLIYFSDEKTFLDFRKFFNQEFPNNRIKTSKNDYLEFL